jgi:hypothetical protein
MQKYDTIVPEKAFLLFRNNTIRLGDKLCSYITLHHIMLHTCNVGASASIWEKN